MDLAKYKISKSLKIEDTVLWLVSMLETNY